MGTYTRTFNFYKPDPTEFIDPESQLNRNWNIADTAVRSLLEYKYTPDATPDLTNMPDRAKFFKIYSNSLVSRWKTTGQWVQDQKAFVTPWTPFGSYLNEGIIEQPDFPLAYRLITSPGAGTTEVELAGAFTYLNEAPIDLNVNVVASQPVPNIGPVTTKYWMVNAGNTTSNYSIARVIVANDGGTNGHLEFKHYGAQPSSSASDENRIELTGFRYCLEVPA